MWKALYGTATNDNYGEISFLDVKELYDAAYDVKSTCFKRFEALMARAEELDAAYRAQLSWLQSQKYKKAA